MYVKWFHFYVEWAISYTSDLKYILKLIQVRTLSLSHHDPRLQNRFPGSSHQVHWFLSPSIWFIHAP